MAKRAKTKRAVEKSEPIIRWETQPEPPAPEPEPIAPPPPIEFELFKLGQRFLILPREAVTQEIREIITLANSTAPAILTESQAAKLTKLIGKTL